MIEVLTFTVLFLSIIIIILAASIFYLVKMLPRYLIDKKEKDFILFTIDMYIDFAKDLNIHSEQQHEIIINELKLIKEKYFKK